MQNAIIAALDREEGGDAPAYIPLPLLAWTVSIILGRPNDLMLRSRVGSSVRAFEREGVVKLWTALLLAQHGQKRWMTCVSRADVEAVGDEMYESAVQKLLSLRGPAPLKTD